MLKNHLFRLLVIVLVSAGVFYLFTDKEGTREEDSKQQQNYSEQKNPKQSKKAARKTEKKKKAEIREAKKKEAARQEKLAAQKAKRKEEARKKKLAAQKAKRKEAVRKKKPNSREVAALLSDSLVSSSDGYFEAKGNDTVSVFSEERRDLVGMKTSCWYNMWGNNVGNCTYNVSRLKKHGGILCMKAGMEDGGSGTATVEFYMDKPTDADPDYTYELDAGLKPVEISVDIGNADSLTIQITNHSGDSNTIALYGMSLS